MAIWTYSGNVYNSSPQGTTVFPLTSLQGNSIEYLQRSHIHVYSSINDGTEWVELNTPADYGFNAEGTEIVLTAGLVTGTWIKLQRITPYLEEYVHFQASSQLTSGQLNTGELFSMYVDQELSDQLAMLQQVTIKYLGAIDLTVDPAPVTPEAGDFYINTGSGVVLNSWTGIAGDDVVGSEQVVYNQELAEWEIYAVPSSQVGVVEVKGTAPIEVDASDTQRPVVSIADASQSNKGSLSAADKTKLDNYPVSPPNGTTIGPTPPPDPEASDQWWDSDDGRGYVYYTDADSSQWVEMNPSWNGSVPPNTITTDKIVDGAVTPEKLDREYVEKTGDNMTGDLTLSTTGDSDNQVLLDSRGALLAFRETQASTWAALSSASAIVPSGGYQILSGGNYNAGTRTATAWINSNGSAYFQDQVGIGTTNPQATLDVNGKARSTSTVAGDVGTTLATKDYVDINSGGGGTVVNYNGASAWGSVAKTEVNGPCEILANLNVALVTRTDLGKYDVVFTTPMPSEYYAVNTTPFGLGTGLSAKSLGKTTSGFTIYVLDTENALVDFPFDFAVHSANAIAPPSGVGADAWCTSSGDGFNIASVTQSSGNGNNWSVVFTTPMPSDDYSVVATPVTSSAGTCFIRDRTSTGFSVVTRDYDGSVLALGWTAVVHASSTVTPTYTWTRNGTTLKPANAGDDIESSGSGDFADFVQSGSVIVSSTTSGGVRLYPSGQVISQRTAASGSSVYVYRGYSGSTQTSSISAAGTMTLGTYDITQTNTLGFQSLVGSTGSILNIQGKSSVANKQEAFRLFRGTSETITFKYDGSATFAGNITAGNVNFSLEDGQTLDVKDSIRRLQSALYRLKAAVLIPDATVNDLRLRILDALETISEEENS